MIVATYSLAAVGHAYDWWTKCKDREEWKTIIQVSLKYLVLRTGKRVMIITIKIFTKHLQACIQFS